MTEAQAIELIAERFTSQWPALTTSLPGGPYPFALTNEALPSSDTFAMCTWRGATRNQISIGKPSIKESRLLILVKLWAPANQGGAAIAGLADIARQIFESQALNGAAGTVTVLAGSSGSEAVDGRWTMQLVSFNALYYHSS